jgi:hypothetical protein
VQSSDPDSEEESFSDVFKLKKSKKQNNSDSSSASKETFSQVNWKRLQSQLRKVDVASTTSEDKSDEDDGEISDEIYEKIVQCPLCTKKIQENTNSWKVNHLKQCAVKHKVSTHQLLKALKLQIKQMEEREALGLPPIRTERQPTSKRNTGNSLMKQVSKTY